MNQKYQGSFVNVVESASKGALKLLELITQNFPSYYDAAHYNGQEVVFHKRAQLAISDLYRTFDGKMFGEFQNPLGALNSNPCPCGALLKNQGFATPGRGIEA